LGAWYQGKPAGSWGKAAYFTTEQSKLISTIMGGVATTNDPDVARALEAMQQCAVSPTYSETARLALKVLAQYILGNPWNYPWGKYIIWMLEHRLGLSTTVEEMQGLMPSRYLRKMSPLQAAIGLQQLKTLPQNLSRRREIASAYRQIAQKYRLQTNDLGVNSSEPAYIRYAFLVDERSRWQKLFQANGIELGEWFNAPIHPMGSSLNAVHYIPGQCPNAEYLANHVVNLPTHPKVCDADISKIGRLIGELIAQQDISSI
jgi:dTDP-4-amino-4,6-dideoxygalactose transaminase